MAQIIDGRAISNQIKEEVAEESKKLFEETGVKPCLAVILVGEDPASQIYVRNKGRACDMCNVESVQHILPADTSEKDLLELIDQLNNDPKVHGILCQLPVPDHIDENKILLAIDPGKDVDGFHPINVGRFMTLKSFEEIRSSGIFLPCTPHGCIELLERTGVELSGAHAVVVGRSNIVGKPVSLMLMSKNATVTMCHSRTSDLPGIVRTADVVVAAIGRPEFIKGDWIKKGAAVIDVGMNRIEDPTTEKGTRLVGDVEFAAAGENAAHITPVPGGVGVMTIAMLMKNTLMSAKIAAAR
ncbi:MAG TPA: bifunctional methylenetetrahydrofolate dehydrogenase/methenyltetrahydrofolate cyclohydrolase FolD [bacterium]|nr:bifunctional methylenetetrahydrofolate dehydrogenase/methenyltetrahydrofolate cyclohydrolase FolD [bacterium]